MIVVMVATLCDESERGKVMGTVMSGVMVGGLLCRPAGVLLAAASNWRNVYLTLAIFSAALLLALFRMLPAVQPTAVLPYLESLKSLGPLLTRVPILRRRACYQATIMVSFGAFWTSIPWRLVQPPFSLGPRGIAIFAFVAVGSAIIAPVAGQAGDRGFTRSATIWAHSAVVAGAILAAYAGTSTNTYVGSIGTWWIPLGLMAVAAMLLDTGAIADQALGRRAVNMVRPEARGRINGLFTSSFFVGQALGAALARPAWIAGGWAGVCVLILVPALVAFALHLSESWTKASEPLEAAFPADL
jgi:predicted MFS family arabinose efflux permease